MTEKRAATHASKINKKREKLWQMHPCNRSVVPRSQGLMTCCRDVMNEVGNDEKTERQHDDRSPSDHVIGDKRELHESS